MYQQILDFWFGNSTDDVQIIEQYDTRPDVACYPDKISQVFMNLIVNACDALKDKRGDENVVGRIIIRSKQKSGFIYISVADNGCGMDSKLIEDHWLNPATPEKNSGKRKSLKLEKDDLFKVKRELDGSRY